MLPEFNQLGDLPVGVYHASLAEIQVRFGSSGQQRKAVTDRLTRIFHLAQSTGKVQRFILFGSYVTEKSEPNDVDIVLVMQDSFRLSETDQNTSLLFDHQQADANLGASIFWIRPSLLILETLDEFIAHWQIKRDGTSRGIVEVQP